MKRHHHVQCVCTFRRRAMDYAAKDIGADLIATGHNLDDTLQTFVHKYAFRRYN